VCTIRAPFETKTFLMKSINLLKSIIIIYVFIVGSSSCNEVKYVEYRPPYLSSKNDITYFGDPHLDSIEFVNTVQVLEYYGEDFKTKGDNIILISDRLSKDWELLWNYTTKAKDNNWLRMHERNKN